MADDVLIDKHDGVAKITLNRPEASTPWAAR